jgi:hypothetical protein
MTEKSPLAFLGLMCGLAIATAVASPASAVTTPTLALSDVTDVTPGQSISATVTDVSGVLCDQSFGVGEWNVYLAWYRSDRIAPVGYSIAQSSQSSPYIAGASVTITANFYVVWLERDSAQADPSTWDGEYAVLAGCMTAGNGVGDIAGGDGIDRTGVPTQAISATYLPVTVSRTEIPQGESLDVTMTDASSRWCNFATGAGFSMGAWFASGTSGVYDFSVPSNLPIFGGAPGVGNFTWSNTSATVSVTVPIDAAPGDYLLGVTCIGPSPAYAADLRSGVFGVVTVTSADPGPTPDPTPPLPETGRDTGADSSIGLTALAFIVSGVGALTVFARRRRFGV